MERSEIIEQLNHDGYVRMTDIPLDDPKNKIIEVVRSVAEPVSFVGQPMVMHIKPQPGAAPASYAGSGYFDLHTDLTWYEEPPRVIGTLCLSVDPIGGDIILVDGIKIFDSFSREEKRILRETSIPFPFPQHVQAGGHLSRPIVAEKPSGTHALRYRLDMIDLNKLDPKIRTLLEEFHRRARKNMEQFQPQPGEALLYDNHRMLHGRTDIKTYPSKRELLRTYGNAQDGLFS